MSAGDSAEPAPPTDDALLARWEERIAAEGDPMGALAEVLGERQATRSLLFSRIGAVVLGIKLERILGAGGMGVTYAGRDADGHAVAVKLVPKVEGIGFERFEQECRLLRLLDHPSIVRYRMHAVTEERIGVLVMDLVVGMDLERVFEALGQGEAACRAHPVTAALLREVDAGKGPLWQSPRLRRRMLRLLAEVADGLHIAHELGVVHRDVKPTNLLLRDDLSPVVIDFGLARDVLGRVSFTQSGAAMGTLAYMAPEQLGRDPGAVDRRTDVYALGLVLYRAVLGVDLRERVGDVVKHGGRPFLLSRRDSLALPIDLQAILYRGLDPRPNRRYATARELAADLRAAAGQGAVSARRPSAAVRLVRDRRKVGAVVAATVALCLLAAWLAWPRGRWVVFVTNIDAARAEFVVEGGPTVRPGGRAWLAHGEHQVLLRGDGVRARRQVLHVGPGPGDLWLPIVTMDDATCRIGWVGSPELAPVQWQTGHALMPMAPGVPLDRRWAQGRPMVDNQPFRQLVDTPTPEVLLVAEDGLGRREEQRLRIGSDAADVVTLPGVMADVDGSFRRTWATLLSPMPAELTVQGTAASWLGVPRSSTMGAFVGPEAGCAFAPPTARCDGEVVLTWQFPEPMRSAVVYLPVREEVPGAVSLEVTFGDEAAQAWPRADTLARRAEFRSERGATQLAVRAVLRSAHDPSPLAAPTRVADGVVFGGHWRDYPPALALVADPVATPTRRLVAPPIELVATSRGVAPADVPIGMVLQQELIRGVPVLFTLARGGRHEVWLEPQHHHAVVGTVLRWSWPDGRPLPALDPSLLHSRRSPGDGIYFGENPFLVPDLDGDGIDELVFGDSSSQLRGAVNSGLVAMLRSVDGAVAWTWPKWPASAELGDDEVGLPQPTTDWNGDGYPDVVAQAPGYSSGLGGLGRVAVLDGRTGEPIWQRDGTRAGGRLRLHSTHRAPSADGLLLLQQATVRDPVVPRTVEFLVVSQHQREGEWILPEHGGEAVGRLVAGPAEGSAVVTIEPPGSAGQISIRRFALGNVSSRSVAFSHAAALQASPGPTDWFEYIEAVDDLDGDGWQDLALTVPHPSGTAAQVVFLSGRDLQVLAQGHIAAAKLVRGGGWLPAVGATPATLLVPVLRERGGERRTEVVSCSPRLGR